MGFFPSSLFSSVAPYAVSRLTTLFIISVRWNKGSSLWSSILPGHKQPGLLRTTLSKQTLRKPRPLHGRPYLGQLFLLLIFPMVQASARSLYPNTPAAFSQFTPLAPRHQFKGYDRLCLRSPVSRSSGGVNECRKPGCSGASPRASRTLLPR